MLIVQPLHLALLAGAHLGASGQIVELVWVVGVIVELAVMVRNPVRHAHTLDRLRGGRFPATELEQSGQQVDVAYPSIHYRVSLSRRTDDGRCSGEARKRDAALANEGVGPQEVAVVLISRNKNSWRH